MLETRRRLVIGAAASIAFVGLARRVSAGTALADPEADPYISEITGYGPLVRDPAGVFDLPEGFSYRVVSKAGDAMSDGLATPGKMDGMGCFGIDADRVALVRNHELAADDFEIGAVRGEAAIGATRAYDRDQDGRVLPGGTTNLVYNLKTGKLERSSLTLTGTVKNCAGGATPWGSWLSCEETVTPAGAPPNGRGSLKSHGWVFEVPSKASGLVEPQPITGLGRFRHEAACVDPRTGVVYLTEDEQDGYGLFYRFLPAQPGELHKGGRLQALGLADNLDYGDARNWDQVDWKVGDWRKAVWIDLDGTDNPDEALRGRGHARGAAWFARGEGIHFGNGELYFACTSGGPKKLGQVMRYRPSPHEGKPGERDEPGRLQLFVQPDDPRVLNMADNLTVAPWGHLIICEDKAGEGGVNYLRAVTPQGKIYTLGRQATPGESDVGANSELAGACFSPDGTTLFVNIYVPGMTLAITGPWARLRA